MADTDSPSGCLETWRTPKAQLPSVSTTACRQTLPTPLRLPEGESVSAIGPRTRASVAVLHSNMPPFHRNPGLPLKAILTGNGRGLCGTERHPCGLCRDLNEIERRRTKLRSPKTSGFVERSNRTVHDEVFRGKMCETFYGTVEAVQAGLNARRIPYTP